MDADLRAKPLGAEGARRRRLTVGYISDQQSHPPDLIAMAVPSVQLCAVPTVPTEYPWLASGAAEYAAATHYVATTLRPFGRRLCRRFERTVPHGRTVAVVGSHYIFFTNPALTVRHLRRLLATKDQAQ